MTQYLHGLLDSPWLWAVVFAVAALDALLPFMPSETTVLTVGVLVVPNVAELGLLILVGAAGAWLGDVAGYTIGRRSGPACCSGWCGTSAASSGPAPGCTATARC